MFGGCRRTRPKFSSVFQRPNCVPRTQSFIANRSRLDHCHSDRSKDGSSIERILIRDRVPIEARLGLDPKQFLAFSGVAHYLGRQIVGDGAILS